MKPAFTQSQSSGTLTYFSRVSLQYTEKTFVGWYQEFLQNDSNVVIRASSKFITVSILPKIVFILSPISMLWFPLLDFGFEEILSNYIIKLLNCYEKSICSDEAVQRKEGINYGKFNYKRTYKVICHHGHLQFGENIKQLLLAYFPLFLTPLTMHENY